MEPFNPDLVKHVEYPAKSKEQGDTSQKDPSDVKIQIEDVEKDKNTESHSKVIDSSTPEALTVGASAAAFIKEDDQVLKVESFALEDQYQNNAKNLYKESTSCVPILVRKTESYELLPRPFRTTNQYLCAAYLSFFCCVFCGTKAIKWAWKTKMQRNKGLYGTAKKSAQKARWWMIASVVTAVLIVTITLLAVYFDDGKF